MANAERPAIGTTYFVNSGTVNGAGAAGNSTAFGVSAITLGADGAIDGIGIMETGVMVVGSSGAGIADFGDSIGLTSGNFRAPIDNVFGGESPRVMGVRVADAFGETIGFSGCDGEVYLFADWHPVTINSNTTIRDPVGMSVPFRGKENAYATDRG